MSMVTMPPADAIYVRYSEPTNTREPRFVVMYGDHVQAVPLDYAAEADQDGICPERAAVYTVLRACGVTAHVQWVARLSPTTCLYTLVAREAAGVVAAGWEVSDHASAWSVSV